MIKNLKHVTGNTRMSFIILQSIMEKDLVCAEVGVYTGMNALDMLQIDPTMKLHLIDSYVNIGKSDIYHYIAREESGGPAEACKAEAKKNLVDYHNRIEFVYKQSEDAYTDYEDGFFDYVYIDGDHDYPAVKKDIEIWYPKVKKGGMLGGHDIMMESVSTALTEFLKEKKIRKAGKDIDRNIFGIQGSDWWIFK